MKITGKHPTKINDPIIKHPAMHGHRWAIDYAYGPHASFGKLSKSQIDEFGVDNMDTWTDTKHNDVDIGYNEFYEDLKPANKLTGGVGDTTAPHSVDPVELSLGQTIEMEHTTDPDIATEIALDHLSEDPKYYTKLRKAGLARELDIVNASSGFGDPDHPINDKKRLGSDITCTAGNNIVGKIGNTPDGHIEGFSDKTSIIDKNLDKINNMDDFTVDIDIEEPIAEDRCYDKAVQVYGPKTSAYRSGAMVKCRQGKIWKKTREEIEQIKNKLKETFLKERKKKETLRVWFGRRGGKGDKGGKNKRGWIDCNTCRTNKETGQKTCKSCGRQAGEKRSKYPACRPTPSQCNKIGTSRKKGPARVSWKKKIKENSLNEASNSSGIITGQNPNGKISPIKQPTSTSTGQAQVTNPKINNGYQTSKGPVEGSGEETLHDRPYDFFQYKRDNAKFGNGNIIKKNGRVSLYELAKQILNNEK